jgi:hypothetical protein
MVCETLHPVGLRILPLINRLKPFLHMASYSPRFLLQKEDQIGFSNVIDNTETKNEV